MPIFRGILSGLYAVFLLMLFATPGAKNITPVTPAPETLALTTTN
jgi:hypothetical protein